MLILAFICFASLIAGWLFAPSTAPSAASEPVASSTVPEPGTSLA